jgi:endoglucanase
MRIDRHSVTRELGRGVNLGNMLEANPVQADPRIISRHVARIKAAGFETVRLPVAWSHHADDAEPFEIDPSFASVVDAALDVVLAHDLNVVLNVHHYDDLCERPGDHSGRFVALWQQIAARYVSRPGRLCFELLNEPHSAMTASTWNILLAEVIAVVRESNPERLILVGSVDRNDPRALDALELPDAGNLGATIHYYAPLPFTHQGARWWWGREPTWLGTTWGHGQDYRAVREDLEYAAAWSLEHEIPIFLGEFGTYLRADMGSRIRWTEYVRSEAERLGFCWAYWDFATDFGVFNPDTERWRLPLFHALFGARGPNDGNGSHDAAAPPV